MEECEHSKRERDILSFWEQNNIFEKTKKGAKVSPFRNLFRKRDFVFFDGPPFATGLPHHGSLMIGILKDTILRYKSMKGYKVDRIWGWDCHGLPVENEVEKDLPTKTKKEIIENVGVEEFNSMARKVVLHYTEEWKSIVKRTGRFVDMDNAYKTMDPSYIESVWNIFHRIYKKGYAKQSYSVLHYCPRCETPLSNIEVDQGYKDIKDISAIIKFPIVDDPEGTAFLAWTTTPWTLPGNTALAVNRSLRYVRVQYEDSYYILAEESMERLGLEKAKITDRFNGSDLIGIKYTPPFKYFYDVQNSTGWRVYEGDFVSPEEGTGIVHIAPAFGRDDFNLSKKHSILVIHHVNTEGKFTHKVIDFVGLSVKPKGDNKSTDKKICEYLEQKGSIFSSEVLSHSYPHCWRCDTPLLNYATNSWIITMPKVRGKLISINKKIFWTPGHIRDGRFGKWLENTRDWAISRSRFWGAPLPVWKCTKTDKIIVIDSLKSLKEKIKVKNRFFFIRHGHAMHQVNAVVSTDPNNKYPLTDKGQGQVQNSGAKLRKENIDVIITSPVLRTRETAKILAKQIGIEEKDIIVDERLKEINFGELEDKKFVEYEKAYKERDIDKRFSTVETEQSVAKRLLSLYYEIEDKYNNKNILLVSHKGVHSIGLNLINSEIKGEIPSFEKEVKKYCPNFHECKKFQLEVATFIQKNFIPLPRNKEYDIDLHRPYVDNVVLQDAYLNEYRHIGDVFDCWFESGMMPYASQHYPFEKKGFSPILNRKFPADFIAEGLDQTRGWFNSLLAVGVTAFGKSPYKAVICTGLILASNGKKMSKSKQNYTDPVVLMESYGADAFRYYMMSSPVVRGEPLIFSEKELSDTARKITTRLHNCLSFYETYKHKPIASDCNKSTSALDKWILSRLYETIETTGKELDIYAVDRAVRPIGELIEDLSLWYLRRSRDYLKGDDERGLYARATLRYVLLNIAKITAPVTPFYSEHLYQILRDENMPASIHLNAWPDAGKIDKEIIENMTVVREVVSDVLEARSKEKIKVRQPLGALYMKENLLQGKKDLENILLDEVNFEKIVYKDDLDATFKIDTTITEDLKQKGLVREFVRVIQNARKNAGCDANDKVLISIKTDINSNQFINDNKDELISRTNARSMNISVEDADFIEVGEYRCFVEIEK